MWYKDNHYAGSAPIKTVEDAQRKAQYYGHKLLYFGSFEMFQESDMHQKMLPVGEFTEVTAWAGGTGTGMVEKKIMVYSDEEGQFVVEEAGVWGSDELVALFRIPYDGKAIAPYSPTANPRYSRREPIYY